MGLHIGPPGNKMDKEEFLQFLSEMFEKPRTLWQRFFCKHEFEKHTYPISEGTPFEIEGSFSICRKCGLFKK